MRAYWQAVALQFVHGVVRDKVVVGVISCLSG